MYLKRKKHMLSKWEAQLLKLKNQLRFVKDVRSHKLDMIREEDSIIDDLTSRKYDTIEDSYNYLLNMAIRSMTETKVKELQTQIDKITEDINVLKDKGPKKLWLEDIRVLQVAYGKFLQSRKDDST